MRKLFLYLLQFCIFQFLLMISSASYAQLASGATLSIVSGNLQTLPAVGPLQPLVIQVRGTSNQPLPGITVVWQVDISSGDDSINPAQGAVAGGPNPSLTTTTDAAGQVSVSTYRPNGPSGRWVNVCIGTAPTQTCIVFTVLGINITAIKGPTSATVAALPVTSNLLQPTVTSLGVMSVTSIRTQFNNIQRRFQYIRGGGGAGFSTDININATVDGQQIPVPSGTSSEGNSTTDTASPSDTTTVGIKTGRWGSYIMGGVDVLKVGGESGFKINTNGITAGADYRVSRKLLVGAALGFMRGSTEIANGAGDQTATGTSVTLYGSYEPAPAWYMDLGLSSGRNSFDIKRIQSDGGIAKASTSGNSTGLTFTGGYSLRSNGLVLTPYGRVDTLKVTVDGFTEEGTSALIVGAQNLRSTVLSAGGIAQYSVSTSFGIVVPQARLEFQRQSQSSAQGVSARLVGSDIQVLVTPDLEIDKTSGTFGLGLSSQFRRGLSVFADYEQLFGKSNTSQYRVSAGLKLEF